MMPMSMASLSSLFVKIPKALLRLHEVLLRVPTGHCNHKGQQYQAL